MQEPTSNEQENTMEGGVWGIVIVCSAFMVQFLVFGVTASIGVYNIELLDYFNDATIGVSLIAAINFGVFLGSGPIVSLMMTKFSYRKIALFGSFLVVIGLLGNPLLPYIPSMCLSLGLLTGFGSCCVYIPSHVLSGLYYDKYRSLATGVATSGSGLGGAIMPVLVGTFITIFTWKGSFMMLAGLCLHLFIFSALLRRPPPIKTENEVLCIKISNDDQGIRPADAESSQVPLLDNSPKTDSKNVKGNTNGSIKDSEETHDFINVDMNELDFIDKLSWRPGAGFVSMENLLSKEETRNGKDEDPVEVSTDPSPEKSNFTSDQDSLCSDEINKKSISNDKSPVTSCHDLDINEQAHSSELAKQLETNGQAPQKDEHVVPQTSKHVYIFTHYEFNIYFINNLLWNISMAIVQSFAPEFLRVRGMTPMEAAWVIGGFGFGCFVGGVFGGVCGNIKTVNRIYFFTIANFLMGIFIMLLPVSNMVAVYITTLIVSGIAFGIILGLLIVVLTDLIGVESLGNGLGYLMLANGIGTFGGPPLAGVLYQVSGGFAASIYLAGAFAVLAGFVMLLIPLRHCSKHYGSQR